MNNFDAMFEGLFDTPDVDGALSQFCYGCLLCGRLKQVYFCFYDVIIKILSGTV